MPLPRAQATSQPAEAPSSHTHISELPSYKQPNLMTNLCRDTNSMKFLGEQKHFQAENFGVFSEKSRQSPPDTSVLPEASAVTFTSQSHWHVNIQLHYLSQKRCNSHATETQGRLVLRLKTPKTLWGGAYAKSQQCWSPGSHSHTPQRHHTNNPISLHNDLSLKSHQVDIIPRYIGPGVYSHMGGTRHLQIPRGKKIPWHWRHSKWEGKVA